MKEKNIVKNISDNKIEMTQSGFDTLRERLKHLLEVERLEVQRELVEARERGDLSENSEYDSAKERQSQIESEIISVEDKISRVKIINESVVHNTATIGAIVDYIKLSGNKEIGETIRIQLVSDVEMDLGAKVMKISSNSPIGKAILGKKINDICYVLLEKSYKIKINSIK